MQLFNTTNLPNSVIAWITPILGRFTFLSDKPTSAISHYVTPIGGDVSYIIFEQEGRRYVLVTADYPDPLHDSGQLQELSGYSFDSVIVPNGKVVTIDDIEQDKFLDRFFIHIGQTYYYLGKLDQA